MSYLQQSGSGKEWSGREIAAACEIRLTTSMEVQYSFLMWKFKKTTELFPFALQAVSEQFARRASSSMNTVLYQESHVSLCGSFLINVRKANFLSHGAICVTPISKKKLTRLQ